MLQSCEGCFRIERNGTFFLSRKQMPNESLQQFWHTLNGLAARCELGEITPTLVHDVFILKMNNKKVQERLCVEPFANPQDALHYAISYEEGMKRQKSMGTSVVDQHKVKSEPVFSVDKHNRRKCYRCGADNLPKREGGYWGKLTSPSASYLKERRGPLNWPKDLQKTKSKRRKEWSRQNSSRNFGRGRNV